MEHTSMLLDSQALFLFALAIIIFLTIFKGIKIVPQQEAWIIENLGKYDRVLEPGLNLIIPFIQRVAYKHILKEQSIEVKRQAAITKDNVTLNIDGVLYLRISDPVNASYGAQNPYFAIVQLAQTTMRSEIGKMTLDKSFEERETLNINIVSAINHASNAWGVQCMRYEIKDIEPPQTVLKAMELQVAAERQKRAQVLESEGKRDAKINSAEGDKREVVLKSEASMIDQVNRAKGEAEAIIAVAEATAKGINIIADSLNKDGGTQAASLKIAEKYVQAFEKIAKESTTLLIPNNPSDISGTVAQALAIFSKVNQKVSQSGSGAKENIA